MNEVTENPDGVLRRGAEVARKPYEIDDMKSCIQNDFSPPFGWGVWGEGGGEMEGERAEYELYARLGTRRGLKRGEGFGGGV